MNLYSDLRFALRASPGSRRFAQGWLSPHVGRAGPASPHVTSPQWISRGSAQLGRQARPFTVRADASAVEFEFGRHVGVRVARDGSTVAHTRGTARSPLRVEATWGAGLVLALALRSTWCMHASAVAHGNRSFLFVGPSGRGKSTLAASIASLQGWVRVADDIAPVRATPGGPRLYPHFPQLKIRPDPWPGAGVPRSIPLAGAYVLERGAGLRSVARRLPRRDAAMALVAGTVATRLFPPDLHSRHLAAMARLAETLPVHVLRVPEDSGRLDAIAAEVAALMLVECRGIARGAPK